MRTLFWIVFQRASFFCFSLKFQLFKKIIELKLNIFFFIFNWLEDSLKRVVTTSLITNELHLRNSHSTDHANVDSRRIPLLEDVFHAFPDMPINLDIKIDNNHLIEKVHDLIVKYEREHLTVWGSFRESVNKKCYKPNSRIDIYFSARGCIKLFLLLLTGLLPFVPLKETHLEVIMPNELLNKYV